MNATDTNRLRKFELDRTLIRAALRELDERLELIQLAGFRETSNQRGLRRHTARILTIERIRAVLNT